MLQLAWNEGDEGMELAAYECISIDYFYLGELQKAQYYHERAMQGKVEEKDSIVKKVTINFLRSRREHRHNNSRQVSFDEAKKQKNELQRLPSPSSLNKGSTNKVPKPINIMAAITEEKDGDDDDKYGFGKKRASKSAEGCSRAKPNFTMKEL